MSPKSLAHVSTSSYYFYNLAIILTFKTFSVYVSRFLLPVVVEFIFTGTLLNFDVVFSFSLDPVGVVVMTKAAPIVAKSVTIIVEVILYASFPIILQHLFFDNSSEIITYYLGLSKLG